MFDWSFTSVLPQTLPGGHAGQPREHPPGRVHPLPIQGPADSTQPHRVHRVQPLPQWIPLDCREPPHRGQAWDLLVPHPLHVHRGQPPGLWDHHQRLILRWTLQEGDQHPGPRPAVFRTDGFCNRRGPDPYHQGEQEAVKYEEAAVLLQATRVQPLTQETGLKRSSLAWRILFTDSVEMFHFISVTFTGSLLLSQSKVCMKVIHNHGCQKKGASTRTTCTSYLHTIKCGCQRAYCPHEYWWWESGLWGLSNAVCFTICQFMNN